VRGRYLPQAVDFPQAGVVERRQRIMRTRVFTVALKKAAERMLRFAPRGNPANAAVRAANCPCQGERLVESLTARWGTVQSQPG